MEQPGKHKTVMCNSTRGHKIEPAARSGLCSPAEPRTSHRTCADGNEIINPKFTSASEKTQPKAYQTVSFCFGTFIASLKVGFLRCVQLFCRVESLHAHPGSISRQGRRQSTEVSIRNHSCLKLRRRARSVHFLHQYSQCYAS